VKFRRLPARFTPPAAEAPPGTATTAAATLFARPGFIYVQRAAVKFLAVQAVDGIGSFVPVRHFNEGEAARLPRVTIRYDANALDGAILGKRSMQLVLGRLVGEVPYKDVCQFQSPEIFLLAS
jgi:hypothetical protein